MRGRQSDTSKKDLTEYDMPLSHEDRKKRLLKRVLQKRRRTDRERARVRVQFYLDSIQRQGAEKDQARHR